MSHVQRHRKFDADLIELPVASATVIEQGDMVAWDSSNNVAYPASSETWDTNLATTQANFADNFVGVAHRASPSGETTVLVATRGLHEFTCASANFDPGDTVGPAKATGNALEDQKVVAATGTSCIGVVADADAVSTAATKIDVMIGSILQPGSMAASAIG